MTWTSSSEPTRSDIRRAHNHGSPATRTRVQIGEPAAPAPQTRSLPQSAPQSRTPGFLTRLAARLAGRSALPDLSEDPGWLARHGAPTPDAREGR